MVKQFLPEVLTTPTKIIIQSVTKVMARAIVHYTGLVYYLSKVFVEHGEEEYYSTIKYCSVHFVL